MIPPRYGSLVAAVQAATERAKARGRSYYVFEIGAEAWAVSISPDMSGASGIRLVAETFRKLAGVE